MLARDHEPPPHRCRMPRGLAIAFSAVMVMVIAAGLSLSAAPTTLEREPKDEKPAPADALHYTGKVKEIDTGRPIAGATVTVRRSILDPNQGRTNLDETRHTTDGDGVYSFTIPPEQAGARDLRIEVDVEHPDYATGDGFRSTLSSIRKSEKMGGRPAFENIECWPSKPIVGHVERPDGSPAEGVSILAYSRSGEVKPGYAFETLQAFETRSSFSRATTDEAGKFKIKVATPGLGVFWILPRGFAGEQHGLPLVRGPKGHVGRFTLRPGVLLEGRVLDVQGKPIAGIFVNAERQSDQEGRELLNVLHVADAIARTAVTRADGSFTLAPLPSGEYRVSPGDRSRDGSERGHERPLPAAFTARTVSLKEGERPEALEIRATPHVVIEAQWFDGKGMPIAGFSGRIFGRIDGGIWFGEAGVDPTTDKSVACVPRGLRNVQLTMMTSQYHALRWRKANGEPFSRSRTIKFARLDHDVTGIEVVRYDSPIVLVRAQTKDNLPVPGLEVSAHYTEQESGQPEGEMILAGGVRSDVLFKKQADGRFRFEQLQPDLEFEVSALADGFKPAGRTLKLAEGKIEEITLVLERR
jgi:hypothetical protein